LAALQREIKAMETTVNFNLPYIMPSQAQKHVTHNEALCAIDALLHLIVASRGQAEAPAVPSPGERHVVAAGATGAWDGQDGKIAVWQDGGWTFLQPQQGWRAFVADEGLPIWFDGAEWRTEAGTISELQNLSRLGLGATADATNPFSARLNKALWTAKSVSEGGDGDLRYTLNKEGSADVLSLLMQSGWSGRAEIGLMGDDDLTIKVSADGVAWTEAMRIDRNSGVVSLPQTAMRERLTANRTYYVSPHGSNSNSGLSAAAPFLTLQKAIDTAHRLDCSIHDVTILLADGTYGGASIVRPLLGGGTLFITGNDATPASVVITSVIGVQGGSSVSVSGLRFVIAASYVNALTVTGGAKLTIGKVDFGPQDATADHISGNGVSEIVFTQDYTVSGGARRHLALSGAVFASGSNRTITLTGTPAFTEFCLVADGAAVSLWNLAIAGAATGKRYAATTAGVINLFGKPAAFLPGDVAGTTASGGVYA
jgi:hypothetical protein